jgi:uncharacterized repeat protein (TIGR03803 family)
VSPRPWSPAEGGPLSRWNDSALWLGRFPGLAIVCAGLALSACAGGRSSATDQTYTIGGTISGLSTSGLILANGSDSLTVSSGAGTFSMPTGLLSGKSYAVTVTTQPTGQTCTVANGAGTISSANVANVVVTCGGQSYSVGGMLKGLGNNSGLVLANGSDTLTVTAGATSFIMPTKLPSASTYGVTVQTQPAGLTCTVTNGAGTIGSANVATVTVTCSAPSYSLGGTLAGLGNSSGLVLANGNDILAVPAGVTSFSMPKVLAAGSTYALTVKTQPTGLTCTVANGTGTISSANVANVVVTCSDTAYPLGGTLAGLGNNLGLVLANGSDTLTVPAGAVSFTLPTMVAYTSSYAVTVQAQPAGLACSVARGTGTMPPAAVTNIQVTCTGLPFTLGGTISGLGNFTGLILSNGTDALSISGGATSFTLPKPVNFASTYSVTVKTAPAGLTCTVTNGSGSMPAANLTTVAVACSDQSYSLGGTISGLTGNGLVLANGTDTLHVTSAATTFAMPAKVAFTSSYAVVVQTQPSTVTCSVANGSGTMGPGNVTSVRVTCATAVYTVGGTISGLTATGLVLLNDGNDATTISANATQFTMHSGVAQGNTYAITVKTQPGGATCNVSNGTGTVGAGNVTSTTVSCAPWSTYPFGALYSFTGSTDGAAPSANLIQASDGNFYGVTNGGDVGTDYGTVFRITPNGTETVLHNFSTAGGDGVNPNGALVQDSMGNFYGTTFKGGAFGLGTIFKITPSGNETVLHSFGSGTDGQKPNAGLILGRDGNFYGTTSAGGANTQGTVFKMMPNGIETVLYSFGASSSDAANPGTALAQGNDGSFYGTTVAGGANGWGTVFRITPAGTETVLYSFSAGNDGALPYAALVLGSDGSFYGTTTFGGASGYGAVFKITTSGTLTPLYGFAGGSDGANPRASLVQAADGNFYGTTAGSEGNTDSGTVFKMTPDGIETVLYDFTNSSDGATPYAGLVVGSDVSFYGTASGGGGHGAGTVFKITPR